MKEKGRISRSDELKQRKRDKAEMREKERLIAEQRNKRARKPKVAPKIGSKVKLEKMLTKQMKSLAIG